MRLERTITEAITQQAAEWLLARREGRLSSQQRVAFMEWLRASPAHVEAYLSCATAEASLIEASRDWPQSQAELLANAVEDLTAEGILPPAWAGREQAKPVQPRTRWFGGRGPALAFSSFAVVCTVLVGALWLRDGERFGLSRPLVTEHGEQRSWPLPDGSTLHLNSGSKAIVDFSAKERLVKLVRGQAMFQVAKDARRRFRVAAGEAQIVALGTAFDVFRHDAATQVTVLEGRVAVVKGAVRDDAPTLAIAGATELNAGEAVDVDATRSVPEPKRADLRRARAWLQREIVFDNQPLSEVVADFNRYSRTPIEVENEELRALPITGVFGAYDLESFLLFVSRLERVRVEHEESRIRILREPARTDQLITTRQ